MTDQPRQTDRNPPELAARLAHHDVSGEGLRAVKVRLVDLWRSAHRVPRMSPGDRQRLAAALYID